MKKFVTTILTLCSLQVLASDETAFLVSRLDLQTKIEQISVEESQLPQAIAALEEVLTKLEAHKVEVFADAFKRIEEGQPLTGLALTKVHSYLKIHLLTLERGLQLADFAATLPQSFIDERAVALMSLSLLQHYPQYLENDRLRQLLNKKDEAYDVSRNALKKAYQRLTDKDVQEYVEEQFAIGLNQDLVQPHHEVEKFWKKSRRAFKGDFWSKLKTFVVHHISGFIGNRAGAVKFRKGTMWQDFPLEDVIVAKLQPMDIITERTPFILTDKLIPGHFGHNAIWLGTEEELKALGVWDRPYMKPYQEAIRDGQNIIESDRSGTHLKAMTPWMNIDEIAVIRRDDRPTTFEEIDRFYAILMSQHGKTYDFNFDVETTDKLVCSELLYQTYGDVIWPTERYLGRYTISPDNVAEIIAQKGTPFKLIYSHLRQEDGKEVYKSTVDLSQDLGYVFNGVDSEGELILEKEGITCFERVDALNQTVKTCVKSFTRPVFGGQSMRRFGYN